MLKKLKDILNTYSDEELNDMEFWINSSNEVDTIVVDNNSINLITDDLKIDLKEK